MESAYLKRHHDETQRQIDRFLENAARSASAEEFIGWRKTVREVLDKNPNGWATPQPTGPEQPEITTLDDSSVLVGSKANIKDGLTLRYEGLAFPISSIRLELIPRSEHGGRKLGSDA